MGELDIESLPGWRRRFHENRQAFQVLLPLVERMQDDLRKDADELAAQEGWDLGVQQGLEEWISDRGMVFRALNRNDQDEEKTHTFLLDALAQRVAHSLHSRVPDIPPYTTSPLFHVLPLPRFTDRLGRPIVVMTLREVVRDEEGTLDGLRKWIWWSNEIARRTLRDYWERDKWGREEPESSGGEGCVVIADLGDAGFRNMEMELASALGSIGPKNFPAMSEASFIVNAGWTQRRLWSVVSNFIPAYALEKVKWIDTPDQMAEFFDLDRLPQAYGGNDPYTFSADANPILEYYQAHSSTAAVTRPTPSRSASYVSSADVFYTPTATPATSRSQSRRGSIHVKDGFRMTQVASPPIPPSQVPQSPSDPPHPHISVHDPSPISHSPSPSPPVSIPHSSLTIQTSSLSASDTGSNLAPLQRIRSLTNFQLRLSPSRLAQSLPSLPPAADPIHDEPTPQARRVLRPAILESGVQTLAGRRARPPLRLLGAAGHEAQGMRSYSDRLQDHHAKILRSYTSTSLSLLPEGSDDPALPTATSPSSPPPSSTPVPPASASPLPPVQPISAFSRSTNPWFGYPALLVNNHDLQPAHPRRWRDLIKTLLFLLMLRIQAWRDGFERFLGLNRLGTGPWRRRPEGDEIRNPDAGLRLSGPGRLGKGGGGAMKKGLGLEKDWAWMVVGFLLVRGSWAGVVGAPLEAIGLGGVRDLLGLV